MFPSIDEKVKKILLA